MLQQKTRDIELTAYIIPSLGALAIVFKEVVILKRIIVMKRTIIGPVAEPKSMDQHQEGAKGAERTPIRLMTRDSAMTKAHILGVKMLSLIISDISLHFFIFRRII
jgi:hypothetical protein